MPRLAPVAPVHVSSGLRLAPLGPVPTLWWAISENWSQEWQSSIVSLPSFYTPLLNGWPVACQNIMCTPGWPQKSTSENGWEYSCLIFFFSSSLQPQLFITNNFPSSILFSNGYDNDLAQYPMETGEGARWLLSIYHLVHTVELTNSLLIGCDFDACNARLDFKVCDTLQFTLLFDELYQQSEILCTYFRKYNISIIFSYNNDLKSSFTLCDSQSAVKLIESYWLTTVHAELYINLTQ